MCNALGLQQGHVSLNPCFNGRYSQSARIATRFIVLDGLNPCFNGRYSQSLLKKWLRILTEVLILVLMEDTLRVENQDARNNYKTS